MSSLTKYIIFLCYVFLKKHFFYQLPYILIGIFMLQVKIRLSRIYSERIQSKKSNFLIKIILCKICVNIHGSNFQFKITSQKLSQFDPRNEDSCIDCSISPAQKFKHAIRIFRVSIGVGTGTLTETYWCTLPYIINGTKSKSCNHGRELKF